MKRLKVKNLTVVCRFSLGRINLSCSEMKQEVLQHYHWQEVSNQPQGSISDTSNWVKEFCAAKSPSSTGVLMPP